jgi:hypothetical protein
MNDESRPEAAPPDRPESVAKTDDGWLERLGDTADFRAELARLADLAPAPWAARLLEIRACSRISYAG